MGNPYKVLGLADNTNVDVCKKRWRELCKKHHPDLGGNAKDFMLIQEAWKQIQQGYKVPVAVRLKHKSIFEFEKE